MDVPPLDEVVRNEANRLGVSELTGTDSCWSLFCYGMRGLAHSVIFTYARMVAFGEMSFDTFTRLYNLTGRKATRGQTYVKIPLTSLEGEGIFVPKSVYEIVQDGAPSFREGVALFGEDYANLTMGLRFAPPGSNLAQLSRRICGGDEEGRYTAAFTFVRENRTRRWSAQDLVDGATAERGFNLGMYVWKISAAQYFDMEQGQPQMGVVPVPQRIAYLCRGLISYYGAIVQKLEGQNSLMPQRA